LFGPDRAGAKRRMSTTMRRPPMPREQPTNVLRDQDPRKMELRALAQNAAAVSLAALRLSRQAAELARGESTDRKAA
jgi:hypothetical protein